ncbi:hypothetical protein H2203_001578 [Taxawa tesnikishii (nom. ined.)]|nr:hypothetical protein H2203_001578 [Dothideales sp. JES 119]
MEHIEEPQSKGGQTTVSHVTAGPSFDASVYEQHQPTQHVEYRVYKRRWFGLIQLVLLNIAVSWDGGPKAAILAASVLILVGNWIRYAGTRIAGGNYGAVLFSQILIGFAQPFVLSAPTRYSDLWFTDKGRVSATAVASLANPLGAALGQLIGPFWATEPSGVPNLVLYTAIVVLFSQIATAGWSNAYPVLRSGSAGLFVPSKPPTPPSASSAQPKLELSKSSKALSRNISFYLIFIPFSVYVGFFNASSSLLNQILEPYGFTEDQAGIAGGIMIVVGLIASAIVSPLVDRTKQYLLTIKILVPLIAVGYLALVFAPETRAVAAPYIICAVLGAASFSLLPCALEYLVEITHPVSPEISSTICWSGGQLLGAVFIIIMDALKGDWSGQPPDTMKRALVFEAVVSWLVVPFVLALGWWGKTSIKLNRITADEDDNAP